MCSRHLGVRCPSHSGHLGQTKVSRTWVPHVGLLVLGRLNERGLGYRWKVRGLRVGRRSVRLCLCQQICVFVCAVAQRVCIFDVTHLVFNERGQGEIVKQVSEESPYVGVSVFSKTFIVEAIHLSDLS